MTSTTITSSSLLKKLTPEEVRAYLIEHPEFLAENTALIESADFSGALVDKEGLPDFQRYRMAKLQEDFIALRVEHEDLMDLMQESLQRQNRIFSAILALLDSPDFESTLRLVGQELAEILEVEAVGFFFETGGWLDQGDYAYLKVVSPGKVARWLNGGHLVMEEVENGLEELYGEHADKIRSQALLLIEIQEGLPPGLLALGHADPMYFATGLATEQVECLGEVIARSLRRFLRK